MSYRWFAAIIVATSGALLVSSIEAQPGAGLKLGAKFEGELGGKPKGFQVAREDGNSGPDNAYFTSMPVTLKAGQQIALTATVVGKDRKVGIILLDPTGKQISGNSTKFTTKTANLTYEEVPSSGKYTVILISDLVGPFTLRANGSVNGEGDIKALEARIADLEKELADARAKLKTLRLKLDSPIRDQSK
jgi:hypothetical protein